MNTVNLCGEIRRVVPTDFGCGHGYNNRRENYWRCTLDKDHDGYYHYDAIAIVYWQDDEQLKREFHDILAKVRDGG